MKIRSALMAATILAAPFALTHTASAQPVTGPYVSLGAGYNIASSQKLKDLYAAGHGIPVEGHFVLKNGFTGVGAIGYGLGDGFRAEIEADYIHNDNSKTKVAGADTPAHGHLAHYGAFVNAYYDIDVGLPLFPYVGAGVGWQETSLEQNDGQGANFVKDHNSLAYQGIVGLSYPISAVPGLSATLEYRFVAFPTSMKYHFARGGVPTSFTLMSQYNNQILVGVRYQLFQPVPPAPAPAPAPAPVAAPAPAPAKTYLVFFDWDKYNLTPRATQIIAQAAQDSHTNNVTTLDVSGYTDTSGTAQYNMGLSERRAQAVAAQLVSDGVAQSAISIHAFGETHLLVPTGPGVREPQNRRVEIVLQ